MASLHQHDSPADPYRHSAIAVFALLLLLAGLLTMMGVLIRIGPFG